MLTFLRRVFDLFIGLMALGNECRISVTHDFNWRHSARRDVLRQKLRSCMEWCMRKKKTKKGNRGSLKLVRYNMKRYKYCKHKYPFLKQIRFRFFSKFGHNRGPWAHRESFLLWTTNVCENMVRSMVWIVNRASKRVRVFLHVFCLSGKL